MKRVYRDWEYSSRKIFALVVTIAAISLLMLIGSIIETRNESRLVSERPVVTIDSLCKSLKKELSQPSKDTLKKDSAMVEKVKDIELSLKILQRCVSEIEEQTASRQDDIRQETNNIINKFNGAISWWLLLLGIVCGFAPLVLAYLNHKNDSEYIKQLNSNYLEALQKLKEHEEKINGKLKDLENKKKEFESSEKKRNEELTSTRKKLELLHTFVYVASFTTKSQFQTSSERNRIVDKLLFELINNSLKCIKLDGEKTPYQQVKKSLYNGDIKEFISLLNSIIKSIPYLIHKEKFNEGYFHSFFHVALTLIGMRPLSEVATSDGRIDMVTNCPKTIYIMEFKYSPNDKDLSKVALEQIKSKKYHQPYIIL